MNMTRIREDHDPLTLLLQGMAFIMGASIVSVSVSFGIHYVQQDMPLHAFVAALLTWGGYLTAHYALTGKLLHLPHDGGINRLPPRRIAGALLGTAIMTISFSAAFILVTRGKFFIASIGVAVAFLAYILVHYETTGTLL